MEILLTNVGQEPIEIDVEDWNLKRYQDAHRASEFTIKCSRRIPITRYALVKAIEGNKVLFRGYIQKPKIKNLRERELTCKGEEDWLLRRFTGRYSYGAPSSRRLIHALQSDAPAQSGDAYGITGNVGLLFMANSRIPRHGAISTPGHYVTAINGGGSTVDCSNKAAGSYGTWSTFTPIWIDSTHLALLCYDGIHYITAENGGGSTVVADRTTIGAWETFTVVDMGDGKIALKCYDGIHYLTAESGGGSSIVATRIWAHEWETFTVLDMGSGKIALGCYDQQVEQQYDWINYDSANSVYRLDGLGTASRIGTKNIYAEGLLLARRSTYADLIANAVGVYADARDLYIRNTSDHGFGPRMMLLAANAYDTGVRLGTIDIPDYLLDGNLQVNFDRILDLLINLAEFFEQHPQFRYENDHTYLDVLDELEENEFILPEEHIKDIQQTTNDDLKPHALIGGGVGSRDVRQIYTPSDHSWLGPWYEATYEVTDGFLDPNGLLKPVVEAEYARLMDDEIFVVQPRSEWPYAPKPNDIVLLQLNGEPERSRQVASLKLTMKGETELELGGRRSDLKDAFNAKSSLSSVYNQEYLKKNGTSLMTMGTVRLGDTTHGWCTAFETSFTVPSDVKKDDNSHKVTVGFSIDADVDPTPAFLRVKINDIDVPLGQARHYLIGDAINELDITDYVNYGTASTLKLDIKKAGEWDGADCSAHPEANVTVTVDMWKRIPMHSGIHYLSAKDGGNSIIQATASEAGGYETFTPTWVDATHLALLCYDGVHYVGANMGGGNTVITTATAIGAYETFTVVDMGDGKIALKCSDGTHFVCAENGGGGTVVADRTVAAIWETFMLVDMAGGKIAIRCG
ncbi:MAG: hypothetical protein AB9879_09685 [Methanothrix sp.]